MRSRRTSSRAIRQHPAPVQQCRAAIRYRCASVRSPRPGTRRTGTCSCRAGAPCGAGSSGSGRRALVGVPSSRRGARAAASFPAPASPAGRWRGRGAEGVAGVGERGPAAVGRGRAVDGQVAVAVIEVSAEAGDVMHVLGSEARPRQHRRVVSECRWNSTLASGHGGYGWLLVCRCDAVGQAGA